jgi:hypothetical protein
LRCHKDELFPRSTEPILPTTRAQPDDEERKTNPEDCTVNLRDIVKEKVEKVIANYGDVVREERFFCACLFHLLVSDSTYKHGFLKDFLKLCCIDVNDHNLEEATVYVEYAMARDLWDALNGKKKKEANEAKYQFLHSLLRFKDPFSVPLADDDIIKFNNQLVVEKKRKCSQPDTETPYLLGANKKKSKRSKPDIETPAHWDINKINKIKDFFPDEDSRETACKLKWGFNIKPDMVIELGKNRAVCIEAKVLSKEAQYGSKASEIQISQTELQKFLMGKILGFEKSRQVFLSLQIPKMQKSHNEKADNSTNEEGIVYLTWGEVIRCFEGSNPEALENIRNSNPTVKVALKRIEELGQRRKK